MVPVDPGRDGRIGLFLVLEEFADQDELQLN